MKDYKNLDNKHESLRIETIEMLVRKYPNDQELGKRVREFINLKNIL